MYLQKKFFIIFLGIILFFPFFVFAQTAVDSNASIDQLNKQIEDKKNIIKQIEDSIEQAKKTIDQKQLQSTSLKNQLSILDNHIASLQMNINLITAKLDSISLRIQQLRLEISDKQLDIQRQKKLIAGLLRNLQFQDRKTSLEILVNYSSFSDFYNNIHYLQTLGSQLNQSAIKLRLAKEDLESKEQTALDEEKSFDNLKKDLENKKADLDDQVFSKQTLLAQTHSSELAYKALLSNLRKQYQSVEKEIASIEYDVRKKLEAQHKIQENLSNGGAETVFSWPAPSHSISAYFHDPDYPYRNVFEHSGIDIRASQGTPIRAVGSGYVAQAKRCSSSSCYSYILIIHDNGLSTVYGHLSQLLTSVDKYVNRGDIIGYSGGTPGTVGAGPFVTGPHLHFEVRKEGIPVNPLAYLASS